MLLQEHFALEISDLLKDGHNIKWVAIDKQGSVYGFTIKPKINNHRNAWGDEARYDQYFYLGNVYGLDKSFASWDISLEKIKESKMNNLVVTVVEHKEEEVVTIKSYDEEHELDLNDYLNEDLYNDTKLWRKWLAVDDDGEIYAYSEEPYLERGYWFKNSGRLELVGTIPFRPENYEDLIIKLEEEPQRLPVGTLVILKRGQMIPGDGYVIGVITKNNREDSNWIYRANVYDRGDVSYTFKPSHIHVAYDPDTGKQLDLSEYYQG